MSASAEQVASALRASVKEAELLRLRNQALLEESTEPIAIVGMACRYPGGINSPQGLWNLAKAEVDAISGFPTDRGWDLERLYDPDPDQPGTSYVREGGFLDDPAGFDPAFFGIGPREALECDPQQRLLLEVCWEALEQGGIVPSSLRRTQTGVFAGAMYSDYGWGLSPMLDQAVSHSTSGASIISGRIAYTLGLEGPAMTVDTACSSSLVTLHLAAQALRHGDCSLALAGGATVLSTPHCFIAMSRQRAFAPDGRSKSFADAADGVGWSEGVGVLVLERLSDAERNGHQVLATVRGSAVNQDGASNGLTAPNGPSQERVIRQALANARLEPKDVDAVEAHGTGTPLGDPIEAGALLATYGQGREAPLKLGSIKSNIGHTQAAAGVAGVIKMVMAMREGVLPKTLHVDAPSSKIDWSAGEIELLSEAVEWKAPGRPRRAAVSSFGVSGTNAHVILEQAPQPSPEEEGQPGDAAPAGGSAVLPGPIPLPLSAKSEPALRAQAERLLDHLRENPELDPLDVGYSLATARTAFAQRAVAIGADREQLLIALEALVRGEESPGLVRGVAQGDRRPVFLFGGYGSQWPGMARELCKSSPAFVAHIRACEEALAPHVDFSLLDNLRGGDEEWLERGDIVQATLFALAVSLTRLWQGLGVSPVAVAGTSQGEVAAAHIAGALSLEEAAYLAAERGRMIYSLAGKGRLVSVALSAEQLEARIESWGGRIEIAAFNGPTSTILSGEEEAIGELLAQLKAEGARARGLRGGAAASHSAQVEVLHDEILEAFASLSPRSSDIPFHSTVEGGLIDTRELNAEYWYRNLRQPVRLEQVTRGLLDSGYRLLIEPSPHPVLGLAVEETIDAALGESGDAVLLGTLRRDEGAPERMALSLSEAHANGAEVDWPAFFAGSGAGRVPLPTYPFQRRRFWLDATAGDGDLRGAGLGSPEHPLLGAAVTIAEGGGALLTSRLSLATHPWLGDHVYEVALLPGTAFVELALRAGAEVGCEALEELTLQAPLILPEEGSVAVQVSVSEPDDEGRHELAVHSLAEGEGEEWTRHATGVLCPGPLAAPEPIDAWPPEGGEALEVAGVYDRLAEHGLFYGPAFQCVDAAWQRGDDLFIEVSLPEEISQDAQRFGLHPALLDATGHVGFDLAVKAAQGEADTSGLALPFAWRGVRRYASGASSMRLRVSPAESGHSVVGVDEAGALIVAIDSVVLRPAEPGRLRDLADRKPLYGLKWSAPRSDPEGSDQRLAILGGERVGGVDAEHYESLPQLLEALEGGAEPPDAVLVASRPHEEEMLDAAHQEARRVQALLRAWASLDLLQRSRLVFLTEGAVAAGEEERPNLASAPVLGLVRSAQSEYPGLFAAIDSDGSERSSEVLSSALAHIGEGEIALREGKLLVPRLTPVRPATGEPSTEEIDPDSTVLITGGLGGIGAEVARHLAAEHGARNLLLASRSGEQAASAAGLRAELEELGATVSVAACDVSDREQLKDLLDSIPGEHPLGAVVHSAGVLADGTLESQDADRLELVMRPKVDAAWHLHELTEDLELSQFLLFSSAAGILGSPGQGNYAAANSFLDALAHRRRAEGLPATSLAWGLWMRAADLASETDQPEVESKESQIHRRSGVMPMSPERGLRLFDSARAQSLPLVVPVLLDLGVMRARGREGLLPGILDDLVRVPGGSRQPGGSLAARLASTPEAERQGVCLELVRTHVAAVLGHPSAAEIEPDQAFSELGFDSLGAVELRNRLSKASGLRLPATVVFDYPTANALGGYLLSAAGVEREASQATAPRPSPADEPIAIVGMSCRYPGGAASPAELWGLARAEVDAIAGFPTNRGWDLERLYDPDPDRPNTCYAREGGFLADAADFDPAFFRISPREAEMMDPQERLMLEASWEALEDAGVDPVSLRGSQAGVFAGVMYQDYGPLPGLTSSTVTGRVAYAFGLEGPTISIDTACSSSLVALHLASQALRQGECGLALAGGVAIASTPAMLQSFSRQRGLSADGRCKPFAEAADGASFSEGVGVLVLERLSEAERNGHQVLATIRGSAINQDGASNGLTAPNGPSQERVIRQALANARLEAKDVDAVEAHGTGTTLGDPIEAGALLATYGQERDEPLKLGSLKSNIGHAQAAAGVAGVIKMVMAMREGVLPKTLHVDAPSSKIDWSAGEIELLTEAVKWNANGRPRRAGVSAFGASGTNAHVILEEAPAAQDPAAEVAGETGTSGPDALEPALPGWYPLSFSARSQAALREAAARLASRLRNDPELDPVDVAHSLATTRASFKHRAAIVASGRDQALGALDALAGGNGAPALVTGLARAESRPVFLFGGQGSQWERMALELIDSSPSFARRMEACEEALAPFVDWSLGETLRAAGGEWLHRLDIVQPALFAVMVSLAGLWRELGAEPAAVVGHSQGEIAAAHIAGALSLDDAARIVALRARAMASLAGKGGMLSVSLSPAEARARLDGFDGRLSLAAINGPASLVVSGDPDALAELQASCERDGVRVQEVAVDYAAHSAQIDSLRDQLLEAFAPISPTAGTIPFYSTVTGDALDTRELGPEYWYRNLRETVLFEPALRSLLDRGNRVFVEIAPHPVLSFGAEETIDAAALNDEAIVLSTLRREDGGPRRFALSLAEAHAHGVPLDWGAWARGSAARSVPLPTYPFQRQRYWLERASGDSDPRGLGQAPTEHPLLGASLSTAAGQQLLLTGRIARSSHPWLAEHVVAGTALLPAGVFLELALRAGEEVGCEAVEGLQLLDPVVLPERGAIQIQVAVSEPDGEGLREVSIHSRPEPDPGEGEAGGEVWTCNARAALSQASAEALEPPAAWPPPDAEPLDVDEIQDRLCDQGVELGAAFQGLGAAWREGDSLYAEIALPEDQVEEASRFGLHPALLQAALQLAAPPAGGQVLPVSLAAASLGRAGASALRVWLAERGEDGVQIGLAAGDGTPLGSVFGLRTGPVPIALPPDAGRRRSSILRLDWVEVDAPAPGDAPGPDFVVEEISTAVPPDASPAEAARAATERALGRLQEWIAEERSDDSRLAIVTRGAVALDADEDPDLAASPLWGLVRSAQAEHPDVFVLLDTDDSEISRERLPAALLVAAAGEPQLAIREGRLLVPRLARLESGGEPDAAPALDPDSTVLISGCDGGLGALVAAHLVEEHGARNLLLACADEEAAEAAEGLRARLDELGCEVRVERCDPGDREQLRRLLDSIGAAHPLRIVVHAGRVLDDGVLASLDAERLAAAMRPKIDAAWNLHELTEELELSEFLLFSSVAGVLGAAAQANYAAANSFLDALASYRRARGLAATSLAWGIVDLGESGDGLGEAVRARMARAGFAPIGPARARELFDHARAAQMPLSVPVELDPVGLRAQARGGVLPAILRGLVRVPARRSRDQGSLVAQLAAIAEEQRPAFVLELVRSNVAAVLGHSSSGDVEPDRAFQELGFDSLAAVELRNRLAAVSGLRLPPTLAFDYSSSAALAAYLEVEIAAGEGGKDPEAEVEAALASLEAMLAEVGGDHGARERVGMRLRAALADLSGATGANEEPEVRSEDLASMSHDEVFALIDEEIADG